MIDTDYLTVTKGTEKPERNSRGGGECPGKLDFGEMMSYNYVIPRMTGRKGKPEEDSGWIMYS